MNVYTKGEGKIEREMEKKPANLICMKKEVEERLRQNDKYGSPRT
jgi:hypothetical protein